MRRRRAPTQMGGDIAPTHVIPPNSNGGVTRTRLCAEDYGCATVRQCDNCSTGWKQQLFPIQGYSGITCLLSELLNPAVRFLFMNPPVYESSRRPSRMRKMWSASVSIS